MSRPQKTSPQSAMAAELLNQFCSAGSMKHILALHRSMCDILNLQPARLPDFYNKLKVKLSNSWKAQAVFKKFDARAAHKHYGDGLACANTRVLIIGAGPCGLRAAIEAQLLGAKVVVIEKRDRMSRNNVLHLWPFVIHDLRNLGAKKFYGKFCAGSIDHISIRQLQCIVLKVALLLGVEFHEGVSFEDLLEPSVAPDGEVLGWRAALSPAEHPVSSYEFDVLIGADGKRNTLRGFARRDFRAKLAIAITANFINRHTEQEARVEEVSGVSFIFKQKFFNDLNAQTGIDLENIVYYKDETHYFVMTAKKQSLLRKGVLIQDHPETSKLLSPENVDRDALQSYAREAAAFTTKNQLPHCDFALNHYGEPDVTLFDFTSMYAAENASMVLERSGRRLLCCLVGDSLLEPFWPTGSGCARGFLSALDAAWAVRVWGQLRTPHPVTVLRERESIYRLLAQTTPENLHRDLGAYTLDPQSRYPNLNRNSVTITRAAKFYNSDDPLPLDAPTTLRKRKYEETTEATLLSWVQRAVGAGSEGAPQETGLRWAVSPPTLAALLRKYRPDLMPPDKSDSHAYFTLVEVFGISAMGSSRNALRGEVSEARMRHFLRAVYFEFKGEVPHVQRELTEVDPSENGNTQEERRRAEINKNTRKKRKSRTAPEDTRLSGVRTRSGACTGGATIARLAAELSRGEKRAPPPPRSKPGDLMRSIGRIEPSDWNVQRIENKIRENRLGRPQPKQAERVPKWDRQKFVARQQRLATAAAAPSTSEPQGQLEQVVHHIDMRSRDSGRPALGTNKVARLAEGFNKKPTAEVSPLVSVGRPWSAAQAEHVATSTARCVVCDTLVFAAESVVADGLNVHRRCFRCAVCRMALRAGSYVPAGSRLTCLHHSQSALAERARAEVGDPDARDSAQIDLPRSNAQAADLAEFTRDDTSKRPRALLEELPPELMSLEPSLVSERITLESSAHDEMDEDEWADRNFLASETSAAGGASDESSSEDEYTEAEAEVASLDSDSAAGAVGAPIQDDNDNNFVISDSDEEPEPDVVYVTDSDDDEDGYSTESGSSSGGSPELEAAREARRREVPPAGPPLPTDSSEVETEDSKSETESSSATEVSTDSEFEQEESVPAKQPPAITVTGPAACPVRPAPPPPPSPRPQRPPDPTDYPLSRTRSAGGLATKLALELKRRYLLGENEPASVRRSDSASRLDSRIQNFTLNISEFQKLLHPATVEPPTEQTPRRYEPQIDTSTEISKTATCETIREPLPDEKVETPTERQMDTDSLSEDSCSSATKTGPSPPVPRLEVHNASGELVQLDSLIITDTPPIKEEFTTVDAAVEIAKAESESSESCKDATTLALTETELSDWAADGGVLDELGLEDRPECDRRRTSARNPRVLSAPKNIHDVKNINALSAHVCGREEEPVIFSNATDHFEFADEGDDVPICTMPLRNAGYMEFVDEDYRQTEDRSIGFIEHASSRIECPAPLPYIECSPIEPQSPAIVQTEEIVKISPEEAVVSPGGPGSETPTITELSSMLNYNNGHLSLKSSFTNITDMSSWTGGSEDTSSALTPDMSRSVSFSTPLTLLVSGGVPYKHMTEESPPPPPPPPVFVSKQDELKRERQQQTEVVRRLVMERIGGTPARKSSRRARASAPSTTTAPPPPPRPPPPQPTRLVPSMSDPELTRVRRRKGIIQTVSDFFNRRVGARKKWQSEPENLYHTWEEWECACAGALRQREGEVNARRRAHASAAHLPPHPTHCCPAATSHSIHHKQKLEEGTPPRLPPLPLKTSSE